MTENAKFIARIKELIGNVPQVGFYTCSGKTTTLVRREDLLALIEKHDEERKELEATPKEQANNRRNNVGKGHQRAT